MADRNKSIPTVPAEQAFMVTVGVSHANTQRDCDRVLSVLASAGFMAGPTSNESIKTIAEQVELVDGLAQNDGISP